MLPLTTYITWPALGWFCNGRRLFWISNGGLHWFAMLSAIEFYMTCMLLGCADFGLGDGGICLLGSGRSLLFCNWFLDVYLALYSSGTLCRSHLFHVSFIYICHILSALALHQSLLVSFSDADGG